MSELPSKRIYQLESYHRTIKMNECKWLRILHGICLTKHLSYFMYTKQRISSYDL